MIERSLVIIKPDGVQRGLMGRILERFENAGLRIIGMKMMRIDKTFARKHYAAHVSKPFYKGLEDFIVEGPVLAFVIEGVHAVEATRKLVGSTEPLKAAPGTIRGDFATHSNEYANLKKISVKNLIHASSTAEEAKNEIALWFKKDELHSYSNAHEKHTR